MDYEALLKEEQIPKRLLSRDKKTNSMVQKQFYKNKIRQQRNKINALMHNFKPGYIEADKEQGQQTLKVTQRQIKQLVNIQTAASMFDLELNMGSYRSMYSHNGSSLLLTSNKGHTSIMNWREKQLLLQINIQENIVDSTFMHNDEMFALAQSSGVYIYDNRGIELHKLNKMIGLEYLPYHFLLAGYDNRSLKYYDTTTGHIIADHVAKNPYTVIRQNPSNAIIAMGSAKGTVEWWTPGVGRPAIKLFVGAGINDIGFHKGYMYTAADDIKVWDSRMLKILHTYPIHRKITSLALSQSGLMTVNYGFKLDIFKDAHAQKQTHPYMTYKSKGTINNCQFVPFEDLIGLGTSYGFSSVAIPGAGVPFYDSFQLNPFETKKQKRQSLVHKLLEKLPMQTITVDPNILGNIDKTKRQILQKEEKQQIQKTQKIALEKTLKKKKMRGKNSIKNRVMKKNIEVEKQKRADLTKTINTKLWAKWAEKKKKQSEMNILNEISEKGIGIADVIKHTKKIQKTK